MMQNIMKEREITLSEDAARSSFECEHEHEYEAPDDLDHNANTTEGNGAIISISLPQPTTDPLDLMKSETNIKIGEFPENV